MSTSDFVLYLTFSPTLPEGTVMLEVRFQSVPYLKNEEMSEEGTRGRDPSTPSLFDRFYLLW